MTKKHPEMAELVNALFKRYRHPDGREYTHKEVEEGITRQAGTKLIDASYLSKLRTGTLQKPSITAIEALCHFFPVDVGYFFPSVAALRRRQSGVNEQTPMAFKIDEVELASIRERLVDILKSLTPPEK